MLKSNKRNNNNTNMAIILLLETYPGRHLKSLSLESTHVEAN